MAKPMAARMTKRTMIMMATTMFRWTIVRAVETLRVEDGWVGGNGSFERLG